MFAALLPLIGRVGASVAGEAAVGAGAAEGGIMHGLAQAGGRHAAISGAQFVHDKATENK